VKVALTRGELFNGNQAWPDNQVVALSGHYESQPMPSHPMRILLASPSRAHLKDPVFIPAENKAGKNWAYR